VPSFAARSADRQLTESTASVCVNLHLIALFAAMPELYDFAYPLFRPLLFRIDPERAHRLTLALLSRTPRLRFRRDPPELQTSVFGLTFSNPIGLAAGMDKNATAIRAWESLGFGFAEIGTITPQPQLGNSRPRIWRLLQHHAMINRMGFPSDGMEKIASRLSRPRGGPKSMRIGVNLGPNRDTSSERAPQDYSRMIRWLGPICDFVVMNFSSPNTPGLREFQDPERIRVVVEAIRHAFGEIGVQPPLLIKLAPDLEITILAEVCAAAVELGLAGIVATNTSLDHAALGVATRFEGGLSGGPLKMRSREVIAAIHRLTRGRMPIIGVGGIASAEDAYGHIRAGASLVELYTGLIYHGPRLVLRIKSGLRELLARDGCRSIDQAVGTNAN
jgi:dihydroorotate dehydrogenase